MAFVPIAIIVAFLAFVFFKEEKAFEKERKNPNRKTGFYKAPKMKKPSELAQEASKEESEINSEEN